MPESPGFLSCALLCMTAQFVACALTWILALFLSPTLDFMFEGVIYFYWPTFLLAAWILGAGEGSMVTAPLYGMLIGIPAYGVIAGLIIRAIRRNS